MDDSPTDESDESPDVGEVLGEDVLNDIGEDDFDVPESVDEDALRRMRTVADLLDEAVTIPGTDVKVGLDPLVSAIPGVGTALSAGISLYIVLEAANLGVPFATVVRMLANVTVDVATGSIPVVGTIFDTFWKANAWNVDLVEEFLATEHHRDRERRAFGPTPTEPEVAEGDAEDADDGPIRIDVTE
ncbi:DUF4112 domain-containing protein [Halomarina rubra]|uniref:DUF4112 domain-containing protein n=1 Tax=Halomarina rubra TaxID=2071873 RepID=A0ABD6AR99_9EURY|nr:DUF4112 domain-containing protein [Halomarina rubra]